MKKKAFTLTELLVVVVIVGVLAAVVLPKFRQVVEGRKTTEAEGIMAAVRSEQEARCLLDKGYTQDTTELASLPKNLGKNFTYNLTDRGITAASKKQDYTLQMKSYGDGRICCDGDDCANLSKDYPSCDSLIVANTECGGSIVGAEEQIVSQECKLEPYSVTCEEEKGEEWEGTIDYKVNPITCTFYPEEHCTKKTFECKEDEKPAEEEPCGEGYCGKRTRTVECNKETGEWEPGEWDKECSEADTKEKDCQEIDPKKTGTLTLTQKCNEETGEWEWPDENDENNWEGDCKDSTEWTCEDVMRSMSYNSLQQYCVDMDYVGANNSMLHRVVIKFTDETQHDVEYDRSDDCCVPSQYEPAQTKLLVVDYTGFGGTTRYYTTSGNNRSVLYDYAASTSFSGWENTFDNCSWGPDAFADLEEVTGLDYANLETSKSGFSQSECNACDAGRCPAPKVSSFPPTVWATAGYVYYRNEVEKNDPCDNHDGYGDLGNNNNTINYSKTCTSIPADNHEESLDQFYGGASQCTAGGRHANFGWMKGGTDSIMLKYKVQQGCPGHDVAPWTCERKVVKSFRPGIVMYDYYYCKKKTQQ